MLCVLWCSLFADGVCVVAVLVVVAATVGVFDVVVCFLWFVVL